MDILSQIENEVQASNENIANIREKLFTVRDIPMETPVWPGVVLDDPNGKNVYSSNGRHLGSVGKDYQSVQPISFLDSIIKSVEDSGLELDLSKLEYRAYKDDKYIRFTLPVQQVAMKNIRGKDDVADIRLSFETGFGGTSKSMVSLDAWRLICTNGMRGWDTLHQLKARHTDRMNQKVTIFSDYIIKAVSQVKDMTDAWEQFNRIEITSQVEEEFVRYLADIKKHEKLTDLSTKKQNIYSNIKESMAIEIDRSGANVWGLVNGATYYTNHLASGHDKPEYIFYGAGAKTNEKAYKKALELSY